LIVAGRVAGIDHHRQEKCLALSNVAIKVACGRTKMEELMLSSEDEDTRVYVVVVNDEEQYSIWLKHKAMPLGWREVGKEGQKAECLEYIDEVWTDMRPLSLRKKMDDQAVTS
jgi:MbtH protein